MKTRISGRSRWGAFAILVCLSASVWGQPDDGLGEVERVGAPVLAWPRVFEVGLHEVVIHQPQLDEWDQHEAITGKAVVVVKMSGRDEPIYGAATLRARTQTDLEDRSVLFTDVKIVDSFFPNIDETLATMCRAVVAGVKPRRKSLLVSLDRVIASVERSPRPRTVDANLEPPPIFFSDTPAILVIFLGEPKLEPVEGTDLLFAANTNWDVFFDPATSRTWLLDGESWLTTENVLEGPWVAAKALPAGLAKLPDDDNWRDVRKCVPGRPAGVVPMVVVSTAPAELILTDGAPQFTPIPGTKLLHVGNTESDLFMLSGEGGPSYYFLAAGRWFRAGKLTGPWSAATRDLPADFARIPEDHATAHVLASVPGTAEAAAAVLLASIPRKATVHVKDVTLTVAYDGEPRFVAIEGTPLSHAVNSPYPVLAVEGMYYCCHQGIWFRAARPEGPWTVATSVPEVVYTIPATSPLYNVTYVKVYSASPTQVTVGYTAGYTGQYVVGGLLVFGLAYAIAQSDDWHYVSFRYGAGWFSYGCGARFDYYGNGYVRGGASRVYGPYGGAGRGAAFNPVTGGYARGAYRYGPRGGAFARQAYNPYTKRYAARAGAGNAYGSWGRSVVSGKDGWAEFGHRSGARGTIGGFRTSEGARGVAGKGRFGHTGGIAKDRHGDAYVGRDGNIYRRNEDGKWQKRSGNGWNDMGSLERRGPNATPASTSQQLNRDRSARQRGNQRAARSRAGSGRTGGGRRR